MSLSSHNTPSVRTWRDIQQAVAPRAMSSEGRKRLMIATTKSVAALFVLCVAGWASVELYHIWEENPTKLKAPVKSAPVKTIVLRTDGVLDLGWVTRTLALPKGIGLMELDLYALQTRLMESGQVSAAVLTRKFPDTLSVNIDERSPVARIMARVGGGAPKSFLVARDGVIFGGIGHDPSLIESLPFLDGVTLKRANERFVPIEGMGTVADLLGTAHANVPQLYRNWQVVSLARLATDGEIVVRSREVAEITFGTRDDFFRQIAQLDLILEDARLQVDRPPLRSVNLAVGGTQVPVAFETLEANPSVPNQQPRTKPAAPTESQPTRAAPRRPTLFTQFRLSPREL